jgi:hypothetical protein
MDGLKARDGGGVVKVWEESPGHRRPSLLSLKLTKKAEIEPKKWPSADVNRRHLSLSWPLLRPSQLRRGLLLGSI